MKPSDLIDEAGRRRLTEVIGAIEEATEGEIVVVVVRASDEYTAVSWRVAVTFAVLVFLGIALFAPSVSHGVLLVAQLVGLGLGHAISRVAFVRRSLLPSAVVDQRLAACARRTFAARGLSRTRSRTGILLLVSILERRVAVLGDVGINDALDPDESWQEVIDLAVAGLARGRAVEGLESALRRCGEMLARHLPTREPRVDQLPDAVVLED